MLNNDVRDVITAFAIDGKYKIIGSNSLRSIRYGSDYDIQTELKGISAKKIADMIRDRYKKAEKDPHVWITDFKCGHDPRLIYEGDYSNDSLKKYLKEHSKLVPQSTAQAILKTPPDSDDRIDAVRDLFILRWKPDDIKKGEITLIDGTKRSLEQCVLDRTTMKIDLLQKVGNQFAEISENYSVSVDGKKNYDDTSKKELEKSLEEDIKYYSKIDSFKSLKRLFSLYQLEGERKNKKKLEQMIDFFNSQVGYLNKIKAELGILEVALTQKYRPVKLEDVLQNLQFIKEQISQIYRIELSNDVFRNIDKAKTKAQILKTIKTLTDYFGNKINQQSKDFLSHYI